jgi:hypothetical protein
MRSWGTPEVGKSDFNRKCLCLRHYHYLRSRGITGVLLASERFMGRIFKDRYHNAVFPHFNADGVCGLELKSADKNFFAKGSEKTFWRSNMTHTDTTLVIGEAVIDALSYALLFPHDKTAYAATGGGMSTQQGELLKTMLATMANIETIILVTDNDEGGDSLADKLKKVIDESEFAGEIKRHSPDTRGDDWNNVLTSKV